MVITLGACSVWFCGFSNGAKAMRSLFNEALFPAPICIVITLITDVVYSRSVSSSSSTSR